MMVAAIWVTGRVGYKLSRSFYVFAEGSGIFQRFNNSLFNTNGYRVIGGVGSRDPNSLFRGEIYGGYQAQNQQTRGQEFGHRASRSGRGLGDPRPTPTVVSLVAVFLITRPRTGRLLRRSTRHWGFRRFIVHRSGGNSHHGDHCYPTDDLWDCRGSGRSAPEAATREPTTIGFARLDNGWLAGASFNYEIWRNLALTLDYQYTAVSSNGAFADFTRNVYTAGLTYRY